ncbi:MAG TPA: Calx-beta domain-containing protein, partial [Candidatus Dormibacteraeota bacterium]|nr:Calx-beta domain-containing protein [Candidatus Dormibacteraeota bacterium]
MSLWAFATLPAMALPPSNNDFVDADVIVGVSDFVGGDTTGATAEPGEPPHFGAAMSSVWYRWVAPYSGVVTFDTLSNPFGNTTFDTVLAAYRGTNLTTLQKVAANDDLSPDTSVSRITFTTVAGMQYYIAIDGFQGAFGDYQLNWAPGDTPPRPALSTGNFEFTAMNYFVTEFETTGAPYAPGFPSINGRDPAGAVITVTRLSGLTGKVSVDYETVPGGGTGVDGVDYVDTRGTLHFDDYQTSARFIVPVLSDMMSNDTKTVTVALSLPQLDASEDQTLIPPGIGVVGTATINIIEIERGLTETNFNIERINYSMQEGLGNVEVDVVLTGENGGPGAVDFVVNPNAGGVALNAGSDIALPGPNPFRFPDTPYTDGFPGIIDQPDYLAATTRLTFGPGQRRATAVVQITNDNQVEFSEDFLVFLRPVANSPGLGPNSAARVTIMNDDPTAGALDREWNPDFVSSTTPRFNATPGANNVVRALVVQPDLRTIIGGDFLAYNSTPRNYIARINPDGSNDDTFNPGTGGDGYVTSLALYPPGGAEAGKILVGGGFSSM